MARARWAILILVAGTLAALVVSGLDWGPDAPPSTETVTINGETFELEIAADREAIERGMMGRESVAEDGGMLFIFRRSRMPGFWMKNCLVDLDVMFLDGRGEVVATHEMEVEPPRAPGESESEYEARLPRYQSEKPARFAIELKSGSLQRLGVKEGDVIDLDLARLKRLAR